jgi:hypothetical protein
MNENPYQAPPDIAEEPPDLVRKNKSLRQMVAILVAALVFQWVFHLATAVAMFGYIGVANVDPVAKVADTIGYGCVCVGMTATSALVTGWLGVRAIRRYRNSAKA